MAGLPTPIPSGFVSGSAPPEIVYATQGIQPLNALPITKDTLLVFTTTASAVVQLQFTYRILLPDGRIVNSTQVVNTNATRTGSPVYFNLTNGFLLSVFVSALSGSNRGSCFVSAHLITGSAAVFFLVTRLFAGYVSGLDSLGWPPGNFESSSAGAGNIRSITGTVPAAGAEISETVPSFARWILRSFNFTLVTSATVANRDPRLLIDDGVNNLQIIDPAVNIAASLTVQSWFEPGYPLLTSALPNIVAPLPSPLVLAQGYRIRTTTLNIQAGDQYTAPHYEVEEWILQ